jgi:DNA-binding beta-propeller fold protein YncE
MRKPGWFAFSADQGRPAKPTASSDASVFQCGRPLRRQAVALSFAGFLALLATAAAIAASGGLSQSAGTAGCISEDGTGPCADGHALNGAGSVAVSGGGKSVYVVSSQSNAVARFNRDTTTGAITQPAGTAGCISEDGSGPCADGHGLNGASSVAVSPDAKSVYVAAGTANGGAIARFNRNTTTGALTQPSGVAGCISESGSGPCADGHGLKGALSVAVSPDGKSVYVASIRGDFNHSGVARFNRNTTTGALTQPSGSAGCITEDGSGGCADGHGLKGALSVAISADGKSVYVASVIDNAVARFNRNTTTGAITQPSGVAGCISNTGQGPCAVGNGLNGPQSVATSVDGRSVYVASSFFSANAVARFNRNTTTGAISQPAGTAGCINEDGSGGCADGHGLKGAQAVATSADGRSVYVGSGISDALVRLNRNTITGAISQPAGTAGCISEDGTGPCVDGHGLDLPYDVAVSRDGNSVYVASKTSNAVARFNRAP